MAQYKVPQDVEAEDKLIGPFSFRQFIYLGIAALGIAVGVGLWQLFPGLIIIPLPFVLLFLILALPLRKDQPMETYLTAVIRFYLKPRRRLWQPEGSISLVTIVAPKVSNVQLTKSVGGSAAAQQLGYLAQVIDTQGWATRGVISPTASMNDIVYAEAQQAEDILDENTNISRTFDSMIDQTSDRHKQSVAEQFRQAVQQPSPTRDDAPSIATPATSDDSKPADGPQAPDDSSSSSDEPTHIDYNPYPSSMHQHVVNPGGAHNLQPKAHNPRQEQSNGPSGVAPQAINAHPDSENIPQPSSREEVSPDILRLANNNDLSISALANEAHRIEDRENEEVVINLH